MVVRFLMPIHIFDHIPLVLDMGGLEKGLNLFKLKNMWLREDGFKDLTES